MYPLCTRVRDAASAWGSVAFLTGSVTLLVDTIAPAQPGSLISHVRTLGGLVAFTIGRAFFVYGSTSDECDALFRAQVCAKTIVVPNLDP